MTELCPFLHQQIWTSPRHQPNFEDVYGHIIKLHGVLFNVNFHHLHYGGYLGEVRSSTS